ELQVRNLEGGLLKTYLLETVGDTDSPEAFERILARSGLTPESGPSPTLFRLVDETRNGIALVERLNPRFLAMYTLLPSSQSDHLAYRAVSVNPMLDHLWLSSDSFVYLWKEVVANSNSRRYGRITFEHESLYDVHDGGLEPDDFPGDERRTSRFTLVDKIGVMANRVPELQESYAPLASITQLRIPAVGRGGHDLYYNGKVTNRSESFLDHRNTLLHVVDLYSTLTRAVEAKLWLSSERAEGGVEVDGAVAELIFSEPLSEATLRRWVMSIFNNRRNRFRISGFPRWLGTTKVQASAIDQHLWQPILLEFTQRRVIAVLPKGTCGNSVNRLISNVQRFVDPQVRAFSAGDDYATLAAAGGARQVG